jgi:hypothetical protein
MLATAGQHNQLVMARVGFARPARRAAVNMSVRRPPRVPAPRARNVTPARRRYKN